MSNGVVICTRGYVLESNSKRVYHGYVQLLCSSGLVGKSMGVCPRCMSWKYVQSMLKEAMSKRVYHRVRGKKVSFSSLRHWEASKCGPNRSIL